MIVASMIENVIIPRCGTGGVELTDVDRCARPAELHIALARDTRHGAASASVVARCRCVERVGDGFVAEANEARETALPARVDLDRRAHSRAQRRTRVGAVDGDAHGDALNHLDPVARGILRGNHGELGTGGLAYAVDTALPHAVRISVDANLDGLARADVR